MSPEIEEKLHKDYPKIFKIDNENLRRKDEADRYLALDCDDGWYDLINKLCRNIQGYIDHHGNNLSEDEMESFQVVATQIKEKFGSLRFYYSGGDEYIEGMIRMAEAMSSSICESCGSKSEVQTNGWIKNLCHPCAEKRKEKRNY